MYKKLTPMFPATEECCVRRIEDGACIPFDPDNTDYQQYLKWLEEGNTPQEADDVTN